MAKTALLSSSFRSEQLIYAQGLSDVLKHSKNPRNSVFLNLEDYWPKWFLMCVTFVRKVVSSKNPRYRAFVVYVLGDRKVGLKILSFFDLIWITLFSRKKFLQDLSTYEVDQVIVFSSLANRIVSKLKEKSALSVRLLAYMSDFYVHQKWIVSGVDCYLTPFPSFRRKLIGLGVSEWKIRYTGLVLPKELIQKRPKEDVMAELDLPCNYLYTLVCMEQFSVYDLMEFVHGFSELHKPIRIIFYSSAVGAAMRKNYKLFEEVAELCAHCADQMIFKTAAEVSLSTILDVVDLAVYSCHVPFPVAMLAKKIPLVMYGQVSRHEVKNYLVLKELGVVIDVESGPDFKAKMTHLFETPGELKAIEHSVDDILKVAQDSKTVYV